MRSRVKLGSFGVDRAIAPNSWPAHTLGDTELKLDITNARSLIEVALAANGYSETEAANIADHLMDCELRGLGYAGLARAVAIIEHDRRCALKRRPITIVKDTPVSATFDGGDDLGYLVALRATDTAIEKAKASGIAVVGASRTHFTGMY